MHAPSNMKTNHILLLLLFSALLLFAQTACVRYQRYGMPKSRLQKIDPTGLSIYLLDAAHPMTRGWFIAEPKFEKEGVTGYISRLAEVETIEVSMLRGNHDAQMSRKDVLLYARPQFASSLPDTGTMTIQTTQLEKVEVCELNHARTFGLPMAGCTGILVLAYIISGE